ncbi:hypothetical protein C8R46DRAFT_1094586 [Mycena filopes]|nr:hypothetical protein C8R46DRAFT_1094586 [Mycena filopes]
MPLTPLTRQEILDLLLLMSVEISPRTKINDEKLNKLLSQVLDSSQYLSRVLPDPPLIPASFPLWKESAEGVALGNAIGRSNADEASFNERSRAQGNMDPIPMHTNAFRDLRHSLQSIASHVDRGYTRYAFQDPEMTSDIRLNVLEVRAFDTSTPILVVQYRHYIRKGRLQPWADAMLATTLKEQHLLLRLLKRNRKRIDSSYQPNGVGMESDFDLSFLLPVGPLTAKDRGKHSTIEGCPNCGETAGDFKRCGRCLAVSYCSKGCQTDHWKTHRSACNSVASGTWKEITVRRPSSWHLNRYDVAGHPEIHERSLEYLKKTPPENAHGKLPFIVKVQLAAANASNLPAVIGQRVDPRARDGQSMLIYDRQASIEVGMERASADPAEFEAIAGLVQEKGFRGLRLFCWATRSGDWTLRICMDHFPEEQKW